MTHIRATFLWVMILAVFTALTQAGSYTREIINWDENTFMLLGAGLLDGTLPFVEMFDNKPPMIFFMFAGWMGLFGETVPAVRLFGDLCLWGTACMIFVIARPQSGALAAGMAGLIYVALHGVEPGFHTTAGFPAMLCAMVALWVILRWRDAAWAMVLAGLLVSVAVLTRSNLAYVALITGIYFLIMGLWRPAAHRMSWRTPIWYAVGGIIPLALMVLVYARADAFGALRLASVDVALSYSGQWSVPGSAIENLRKWVEAMAATPVVHVSFTALALVGMVWALKPSKAGQGENQGLTSADWLIVWIFLLSTLFSILKSGAVYTYYWQQFFPFVCLFIAALIGQLRNVALRAGALGVAGICALGALWPNAVDSLRVMARPTEIIDSYDVRKAADFLEPQLTAQDRIWALDRHLIHVYLDQPVISRILAHPSNITRQAIIAPLVAQEYLPEAPLQQVMDSRPEYLVSNGHDDLFYFRLRSTVDIRAYVSDNYDLIYDTPVVTIWRRKGYGS